MNSKSSENAEEIYYPEEPHIPLYRRILGIIRRNPVFVKTMTRIGYRHKIGAMLNRQFHKGYAGPPVRLKINLTRLCNLRCQMCIQDRRDSEGGTPRYPWNDPKNQLPLAPWVDLLDQTVSFHPLIAMTGGEPLMYPHFREFIMEAKKRGFVIELVTNGTLLAREAEFLVEQGVEMLIVSLDGLEEQHDQIRGHPGSFRRSIAGIQALVKVRSRLKSPGPLISINCTISKKNLAVLDQMPLLAARLNVDHMNYLHTIFDWPDNVERHNRIFTEEWVRRQGLDVVFPSLPQGEFYESEITAEDVPFLQAQLGKGFTQGNGRVVIKTIPHLSLEEIKPYYLDLDYPFRNVCRCLWADARILPNGTIIPCLHVLAGNITEKPFMELWNSPEIKRFRELVKNGLFPGCARCCCRQF